jgi:outer membrane protein, adhesin transport system
MHETFRPLRLSAVIAVALSLPAAHAFAEDLRSVVAKTLSSNPELSALAANRLAIDEELEAAKGLSGPTIDVKAATGSAWLEQQKDNGIDPGFKDQTGRVEMSGIISVPVFDGWKTYYEVDRNAARVESARFRVSDTANSLGLQAIQTYLEVQRASTVTAVAEKNVRAHRTYLSRVQTRVSGGNAAQAESLQARARLASADAALIEAQARLNDAFAAYIAVVGEAPGRLEAVGMPRLLPPNVQTAVEEAYDFAPSLAALRNDITAAKAAIGTAQAEFYPKVSIEIAGDTTIDADQDFSDETNFSTLLLVKKNLYNGGVDTARLREARHRADQAGHTAMNARRQIEKEVRLSWIAMRSASDRRIVLGRQLDQNRALVKAYEKQFDIGQRSLMDILDVQNEIFTTETTAASEAFSATFNAYRVLASTGKLLEVLNLDLPEEAVRGADRSWHVTLR